MMEKQYKTCPECKHEYVETHYDICHNCGYNFAQYSSEDADDGDFAEQNKYAKCDKCYGLGYIPNSTLMPIIKNISCPKCKGTGWITQTINPS